MTAFRVLHEAIAPALGLPASPLVAEGLPASASTAAHGPPRATGRLGAGLQTTRGQSRPLGSLESRPRACVARADAELPTCNRQAFPLPKLLFHSEAVKKERVIELQAYLRRAVAAAMACGGGMLAPLAEFLCVPSERESAPAPAPAAVPSPSPVLATLRSSLDQLAATAPAPIAPLLAVVTTLEEGAFLEV